MTASTGRLSIVSSTASGAPTSDRSRRRTARSSSRWSRSMRPSSSATSRKSTWTRPSCTRRSSRRAGVAELLDMIVKLLPDPTEGNPPEFMVGEGAQAQPMKALPDPSLHVLAHVFKVTIDAYVGKMGIFRVHQGTVTRDSPLYIGDGRKPFKVGHLFMLQGKDHVEVSRALPGDIVAVAKVDEIHF